MYRDRARISAPIAVIVSVFLTVNAHAENISVRGVSRIADGVYVISDRADRFEGGNTTVITGEDSVLVIDTTLYPYAAREDIAKIRELTDKPVRYVLNTHWHNDHVSGNAEYRRAFPGCSIIAHRQTRLDMDLNIPNAAKRLLPRFEADAARDYEFANGAPEETDEAEERQRRIVDDYRRFEYERPDLAFNESLVLDLGNREVTIEFLGRGNTNGDAIARIPAERILVTGDLVVSPVPFVFDGYPSEWVETLDRLMSYDVKFIIPGHGEVQSNWGYARLLQETMQSTIDQINARLHVIGPAEFRTFEEVRDHVDLGRFRERYAGNDEALSGEFDAMADRLAQLAFREASLR